MKSRKGQAVRCVPPALAGDDAGKMLPIPDRVAHPYVSGIWRACVGGHERLPVRPGLAATATMVSSRSTSAPPARRPGQ